MHQRQKPGPLDSEPNLHDTRLELLGMSGPNVTPVNLIATAHRRLSILRRIDRGGPDSAVRKKIRDIEAARDDLLATLTAGVGEDASGS
jgi:hypothetical protein